MYGNFFYHDKKIDEYAPAELAMVKYTFQDGILKRFHTYISPGMISKYQINYFLSKIFCKYISIFLLNR